MTDMMFEVVVGPLGLHVAVTADEQVALDGAAWEAVVGGVQPTVLEWMEMRTETRAAFARARDRLATNLANYTARAHADALGSLMLASTRGGSP